MSVCACLPLSRPIRRILTTKRTGLDEICMTGEKAPRLSTQKCFCLPPSQGVKHWWAAGAAAEPLDGALSFSSGGLASSHLILDFTHGTKEPGGFTSKKGFSWFNPALRSVCVFIGRQMTERLTCKVISCFTSTREHTNSPGLSLLPSSCVIIVAEEMLL